MSNQRYARQHQNSTAIAKLASSNFRELINRGLFTLFILIICRIGSHIPLPFVRAEVVLEVLQRNSGGLLGMLDMFSGGAVGQMAIMAMGLMPYISASIIVQLLTSTSPYFETLKKDGGEAGKRILNKYTKYGAIIIGTFQALGVAKLLEMTTSSNGIPAVMNPGWEFKCLTAISLVTGTLFLVWLSERITERGIGNGSSMIIYAGIVANIPASIARTVNLGKIGAISNFWLFAIIFAIIATILFVIVFERAYKKVIVTYIRGGAQSQSAHYSYMPMKLNQSGVIAPIFASAMLSIPQTFIQFFASTDSAIATWLAKSLTHGNPVFMTLYLCLIVFFSFFYAPVVFDAKETADNMKKGGAFVQGYRPGEPTQRFFSDLVNKLTLIGAIYISIVCIVPELVISVASLQFYFGGTSILIVVGVSIDTIMQIRSHMMGEKYAKLAEKPWMGKLIK